MSTSRSNATQNAAAVNVPSSQIVILDEEIISLPPSRTITAMDHDYSVQVNPPVAMAVLQPEGEDDEHRSALERMQELDSIKSYLTETEYATKRQAILDSI